MRFFISNNASLETECYALPEQPMAGDRVSRRRRGATVLEYLFMISLILTVAITAIGYFGQSTKETTQKASDAMERATQHP
jgi:hypothetical protein